MNRIIYFNLTYYCNNSCIYCFSHSTGSIRRQVNYQDFCHIINELSLTNDDIIVLNGGEPSIHPDFYNCLEFLDSVFNGEIVVYSNGVSLRTERITGKVRFVIPIHGYPSTHNWITGNSTSFNSTIATLVNMQNNEIPYSLKFIINNIMIDESFQVSKFITANQLRPRELMFARQIQTIKACINNVQSLSLQKLENFVQNNDIRYAGYKIKLIDIPICFFDKQIEFHPSESDAPTFIFNDDRNRNKFWVYMKKVKLSQKCTQCKARAFCELQEQSYLTASWNHDAWILESE